MKRTLANGSASQRLVTFAGEFCVHCWTPERAWPPIYVGHRNTALFHEYAVPSSTVTSRFNPSPITMNQSAVSYIPVRVSAQAISHPLPLLRDGRAIFLRRTSYSVRSCRAGMPLQQKSFVAILFCRTRKSRSALGPMGFLRLFFAEPTFAFLTSITRARIPPVLFQNQQPHIGAES